jgi:hypothetical protein
LIAFSTQLATWHPTESSGEDVSSVLISVRNDVMNATDRRQLPSDHSALTARVYFGGAPSYERLAEETLWSAVKEANDHALLGSYLDRYPRVPRPPPRSGRRWGRPLGHGEDVLAEA